MTYPNAIQFSSEHSVNNQGLLDLTLSYNNKVIAQRRNNLTVGNKVLICNRDRGTGIHVYSATITKKLDYPSSVWFNHGGRLWQSNWEVEPSSEVVYLTEDEVRRICGSSMNWHKDLNHKKLIKIMYFISDVKDENGPTNFFNKKDSKYIKYINFPNYFSDSELAAQKITFNQQKCLGNSGESFMLDTAKCFHMGSRSKKDRLQIIITISPYASKLYPFKSVHVDKHLKDFNRSLYESFKVI